MKTQFVISCALFCQFVGCGSAFEPQQANAEGELTIGPIVPAMTATAQIGTTGNGYHNAHVVLKSGFNGSYTVTSVESAYVTHAWGGTAPYANGSAPPNTLFNLNPGTTLTPGQSMPSAQHPYPALYMKAWKFGSSCNAAGICPPPETVTLDITVKFNASGTHYQRVFRCSPQRFVGVCPNGVCNPVDNCDALSAQAI